MTIEEFASEAGYESVPKMNESLKSFREMSVREADATQLANITEIIIDHEQPVENREAALLKKIRNPYCFRYNDMVVKVTFAGKRKLDDCIAGCISLK